MMVKDQHGRSGLQRFANRIGWRQTKARRQHLYRSGPLGRTGWGTFGLPGPLASTTLSEHRDSYNRPFVVLETPSAGHFSIVIACEPDGASLVDQHQIESWVGQWGHWLASLGHELGIVAAAVTVETAPDTGARLRREVTGRIDPDAPDLAKGRLAGFGVNPMIFGDLKPDYVDLIREMGGQVIELARGRGSINILDPGEATAAAERLTGAGKQQVLVDAHGSRLTMVGALITILRGDPPTDREEAIVDRALKILDDTHVGIPVLGDLLKVI